MYGFDLSQLGEECIYVHFPFVIAKIMRYNSYLRSADFRSGIKSNLEII